jgi:hypothetical protein
MSRDNPLWGAPRIRGELFKLGIDIGETSVAKYMARGRKPPSETWRTFLENHFQTMVSIDFFTPLSLSPHCLRPFWRRFALAARFPASAPGEPGLYQHDHDSVRP